MSGFRGSLARTLAVIGFAVAFTASRANATGVPIDGFLPMVGITLTDEFVDDIDFFPHASTSVGGDYLSQNGSPRFDVALLDTGAAVSLLTTAADAAFNIDGPYSGQPDGFKGTEFIQIGGATGLLEARVSDPLGLYAAGLQTRTGGGAALSINTGNLLGQTNTSVATLPVESPLPNILGLPFASQYATRIRNSLPQVFDLEGKTVRSPAIDFLPLGSGATHGITRKAPMSLQGEAPSTPFYQLNFGGIGGGELDFYENPSSPTIVQGGHFLNVNAANNGAALNSQQFFFDTGASVTVLSELTALQLGIDIQTDTPDFTLEIVGSGGGSGAVPGFFIDQFTVLATGGSVTLSNVPVLVFDVTNPASPGNIVPGIVGTNVFAGRDIIIDPNPSLGGGGSSAGVYISDAVTSDKNWSSTAASASWAAGGSWNGGAAPTTLGIANVRNVGSGNQEAVLSASTTVYEMNVSGVAARAMTVRVQSGAKLTTFTGINVEKFGAVQLDGGALDAQYVEIMGGTLSGSGSIATGSGPIDGQVENRGGVVAPGNGSTTGTISIRGRFANAHDGAVNIDVGGTTAGTQYDRLLVNGTVALDGVLNVSLVNLGGGIFTPALGSFFSIIEGTTIGGTFSTLNMPTLPSGRMWVVDYEETAVKLKVTLPGDFDGDWNVDADDLALWKTGYGTTYNGNDLLQWQRYFGQSIAGAIAAVPEPTTGGLMLVAAAGLAAARRRRGV
ncbi:aspartyl protease family protein [Lacipirellula sp.]|uniref:aspartyl protease family protein n=1 Tax=Lacipirellula sp. TaxID=2691419 RepID=UPI003D0C06B3